MCAISVDFSRILDRSPTNLDWARLLVAFSALQTVDLTGHHKHIAPALKYLNGEMATGLSPALDLLYIQGWPTSSVDKFCEARWVSGHLVTVAKTYEELVKDKSRTYSLFSSRYQLLAVNSCSSLTTSPVLYTYDTNMSIVYILRSKTTAIFFLFFSRI